MSSWQLIGDMTSNSKQSGKTASAKKQPVSKTGVKSANLSANKSAVQSSTKKHSDAKKTSDVINASKKQASTKKMAANKALSENKSTKKNSSIDKIEVKQSTKAKEVTKASKVMSKTSADRTKVSGKISSAKSDKDLLKKSNKTDEVDTKVKSAKNAKDTKVVETTKNNKNSDKINKNSKYSSSKKKSKAEDDYDITDITDPALMDFDYEFDDLDGDNSIDDSLTYSFTVVPDDKKTNEGVAKYDDFSVAPKIDEITTFYQDNLGVPEETEIIADEPVFKNVTKFATKVKNWFKGDDGTIGDDAYQGLKDEYTRVVRQKFGPVTALVFVATLLAMLLLVISIKDNASVSEQVAQNSDTTSDNASESTNAEAPNYDAYYGDDYQQGYMTASNNEMYINDTTGANSFTNTYNNGYSMSNMNDNTYYYDDVRYYGDGEYEEAYSIKSAGDYESSGYRNNSYSDSYDDDEYYYASSYSNDYDDDDYEYEYTSSNSRNSRNRDGYSQGSYSGSYSGNSRNYDYDSDYDSYSSNRGYRSPSTSGSGDMRIVDNQNSGSRNSGGDLTIIDMQGGTGSQANTVASSKPGSDDYVTVDDTYFVDALFIGDSRFYGFSTWSELPAIFYGGVGFQLYNYENEKAVSTVDGKKPIFEAIPYDAFSKIYIKTGLNEMGWGTEADYEQLLAEFVEKLREKEPNAVIYIHGLLPVTQSQDAAGDNHNNANIKARNEALKKFAPTIGAVFLDVAEVYEDGDGCLPENMASDGIHLKAQYIDAWKEYLLNHAVLK